MRRLVIAAVFLVALFLVAAMAHGQLVQEGNLRVSFDAHLQPHALPRERAVPVTVHIEGSVGTVDGSRPPQLRQLAVAVNRAGHVSVAGLPVCPAALIQQTSTEAALNACRGALVGHGSFAVNVDFPDAPLIPARGKVTVFNSRIDRQPGLLLHLYGTSPVKAAFVLPFKFTHRSAGKFGTVFSARIPELASDLGYVTDIELTLGRKYRYRGQRRSFLSASCAAPAGFPGAIYELAKATFSFPEAVQLTSRLPSDCSVR